MYRKTNHFLDNHISLSRDQYNVDIQRILDELLHIQQEQEAIRLEIHKLAEYMEENRTRMQELCQNERERSNALVKAEQENQCAINESVWAHIFNNTIANSAWLKDKTFSPGRWALGYQALYVLYRALDEVHPTSILELGLGQSTNMISQYAALDPAVEHIVIEHDPEWIKFYLNRRQLSANSHILQLEREMVPYKDATAVRVFTDFKQSLDGKKFDLILIDAPLGGDMKQYARIDILSILPDCLKPSFVILLDDTQRAGEHHTQAEIDSALNSILHKKGIYSGAKELTIWTDERHGFLCTM